jgi:hypothetical protein
MTRVRVLAVCITAGFAWFHCAQIALGDGKVKIDVRGRTDAIRNDILKYTPIGTGADDVTEFILSRLYSEGGYSSGIGTMPRPGIAVTLGHRSGLFSHISIQAQWKFDDRLKLQDVQIEEMPQEGGFDPHAIPGSAPKIRIDLLQSDETIRQQLLTYTPTGSPLKTVFAFLGRLHYLGGPVSGVALTGKRGIGVVLGHAIESTTGRDRMVQVNWVQDERDSLVEIQIRRVDWPTASAN